MSAVKNDASVRSIVVIGASAGGIDAIGQCLAGLPRDFVPPLLIVMHISARSPLLLDRIFSKSAPSSARYAADGDLLVPHSVLIAPADRHLLVEQGRVRVVRGPKENRS